MAPSAMTSGSPKVADISPTLVVMRARLGRPSERRSSAIGWSPRATVAPPGGHGSWFRVIHGVRRSTPSSHE